MKRFLILALAVALVTVLVPAAWCARYRRAQAEGTGEPRTETPATTPTAAAKEDAADETITVLMASSGEIRTLPMRDYLICTLACEMPAAYEPEALKAQALASVTLARYKKRQGGSRELSGAAISTDPKQYQGYLSVEEMRARWGENFDSYYKKLCDAADAVLPLQITYDGEPILAAFHAVSSGVTESSETVWHKALPYLVNCESEGDRLSPGYASQKTVTPEELCAVLSLSPAEDLPPEDWAGEARYSAAGTLTGITLCGKTFTGQDLREAFDLRSAAIRLTYDGQNFIFDVTGYGHGVGLSQYGADYYARQGMDFRQIIAHYYPGTEITPAFSP